MAQKSSVLMELEEGDKIGPGVLLDAVDTDFRSDSGVFTLAGSLLDYKVRDHTQLLRFERSDSDLEYQFRLEWSDELDDKNARKERNRLKDSFLRAGLIHHSNITQVIEQLRQYDDIIVGVDTNILWDCILTSQLLDRIYDKPFPNWILIAIPKLVMAETENAANNTIQSKDHPRVGWPTHKGRLAQRGLEELMNLKTKNPDRPGVAIMTVGKLNTEYDEVDHHNWKLDSRIRTQFQQFLNNISFHKGTFFLSQDRVNVMMSGTEGADGLYLQKPDIDEFSSGTVSDDEFTVLLYELAVQFGGIRLEHAGDRELQLDLDVFWPGKEVTDWRESRLKVTALHSG